MKLNLALARPYSCHALLVLFNTAGLQSMCAYLGLVECVPLNFFVEGLGDSGSLEDTVLTEEKPVFECEFCEGEANDEALPWEERPVEPAGQALDGVSTL
jgi:hypothetical protein